MKTSFLDQPLLIVDDERFARGIAVQIARDFGFRSVFQASDGTAACALLNEPPSSTGGLPIGGILADYNMPLMNGLALLKEVRLGKTGIAASTPFALLTGHSDRDIVETAMRLDVTAFITKPVSAKTLGTKLAKALSEEPTIRPAMHYAEIEVVESPNNLAADPSAAAPAVLRSEMIRRLNPSRGGDSSGRLGPSAFRAGPEVCSRLASVQPGAVLSRLITSASGVILLGEGTVLTDRRLQRLRGMSAGENIENVWIEVKTK